MLHLGSLKNFHRQQVDFFLCQRILCNILNLIQNFTTR
nr:MAG TPA: hypothetical protein [Caudoviricetes sp.]